MPRPYTCLANGHRPRWRDHARNATTPSKRNARPPTTTHSSVVKKINSHPPSAIATGSGYSHMRYGRAMSGATQQDDRANLAHELHEDPRGDQRVDHLPSENLQRRDRSTPSTTSDDVRESWSDAAPEDLEEIAFAGRRVRNAGIAEQQGEHRPKAVQRIISVTTRRRRDRRSSP